MWTRSFEDVRPEDSIHIRIARVHPHTDCPCGRGRSRGTSCVFRLSRPEGKAFTLVPGRTRMRAGGIRAGTAAFFSPPAGTSPHIPRAPLDPGARSPARQGEANPSRRQRSRGSFPHTGRTSLDDRPVPAGEGLPQAAPQGLPVRVKTVGPTDGNLTLPFIPLRAPKSRHDPFEERGEEAILSGRRNPTSCPAAIFPPHCRISSRAAAL